MEKPWRRICMVQCFWDSNSYKSCPRNGSVKTAMCRRSKKKKSRQRTHSISSRCLGLPFFFFETFIPGTLKVVLRCLIPFWNVCLDCSGWKSASSACPAGGGGSLNVTRRQWSGLWTWRCDPAECSSGLWRVLEGRGVEKGVVGGCCSGGGFISAANLKMKRRCRLQSPRFLGCFFFF